MAMKKHSDFQTGQKRCDGHRDGRVVRCYGGGYEDLTTDDVIYRFAAPI